MMIRIFTIAAALVVFGLAGCGTENPFDRGPDFDNDVIDPGQSSEISFSTSIKPILQKCEGCHSGGTGGWTYDGGGGAHGQALSVVDLSDPEGSLLVVKAIGGDAHGGGAVISNNSDSYNALLVWIQEGAKDN